MDKIWQKLEETGFKVSTDTRKDLSNSVFFAIKGDNFDANLLVQEALDKGAVAVVTQNEAFKNCPDVFWVADPLDTLQRLARRYRDQFHFPILAIGGSNGKTTTRELAKSVLALKFKTFATEENLNNHIGLPLSIFLLKNDCEIGVFEIGANHLGEHLKLLEILNPTHVLVTNSGLDHLEGFGSPDGVIRANNEIIEWAADHGASAVNKENPGITLVSPLPLTLSFQSAKYQTQLVGNYNLENILWAISVGKIFGIETEKALEAMAQYRPNLKRSQLIEKDGMKIVLDCYNANPTSMQLALDSFVSSASSPCGVILGDMLELGNYSETEHKKILQFLEDQKLDLLVLIGPVFQKLSPTLSIKHFSFANSLEAKDWFKSQNLTGYTLLLKGSRGIKVERVIED